MDFELTADQIELRDGIRRLLGGRFPLEKVRTLTSVDRGLWGELADAGVFAVRTPSPDDGLGLGMADAVLVFEELGRSLVPGPLIGSELAARLDPSLAWGGAIVGVIEDDGTGAPLLVEHLASLDRLLVVGDEGVWSVPAADVEGDPVARPVDFLTPLHLVPSLPRGEQVGDAPTAERVRLEGTLLASALLVGSAQAVTDLAVEYAKNREQFDRPIGSFQAVKHLLADMQVRATVAQAAVHAAGVTFDDPTVGDLGRIAAAAKVTAGESAVRNAKAAVQVHGGMGFTWEVDVHLHLKRAWVLDTTFGSTSQHAEALAQLL